MLQFNLMLLRFYFEAYSCDSDAFLKATMGGVEATMGGVEAS